MKPLKFLRNAAEPIKPLINLVRNRTDEATIYIYDEIDPFWGISAQGVIAALNEVANVGTLHLRINSPGGDVFEARAIAEAIKRFSGKTIAHIDSLAASAASTIAIAADEVEIAQGAFFMIHNAAGVVFGDKKAMRETADLIEKVEGAIIHDYVAKTGKDASEIVAWMDAETWFNADEAIANGFCDRLAATAQAKPKNMWNLKDAYKKVPKALLEPSPSTSAELPEPEPEQAGTTQTNTNTLRLAMIV